MGVPVWTCVKVHWLTPHPSLAELAAGYVVVDDRLGRQAAQPVTTAPAPYGVLSVNLADRSLDAGGRRHPEAAFLGLQSVARVWTAGAQTAFVMILLRAPGVMRLFAQQGATTGQALLDLRDLWGDRRASALVAALSEAFDSLRPTSIDAWLAAAFAARPPRPSLEPAERLVRCLRARRRVDVAARALGVSTRTLQRRFRADLGVSPQHLLALERMQRSLQQAQRRGLTADPADFADQAHEIRAWRGSVGTTPGRYQGSSPAHALTRAAPSPRSPVFYL